MSLLGIFLSKLRLVSDVSYVRKTDMSGQNSVAVAKLSLS